MSYESIFMLKFTMKIVKISNIWRNQSIAIGKADFSQNWFELEIMRIIFLSMKSIENFKNQLSFIVQLLWVLVCCQKSDY